MSSFRVATSYLCSTGSRLTSLLVDPLVEVPVLIQHIGDAAGHTGREVLAGLAQNHHRAAGHVLAAVVANALHNGGGTAVAHGEALTGHAGDERLAAGSTVQGHVAGDDVLFRFEGGCPLGGDTIIFRRRGPFPYSRCSRPSQLQRQAARDEGTEGCRRTHTVGGEDVIRQAAAVVAGDLAAKDGTKGAVGVGDIQPSRSGEPCCPA